MKQVRGDAVAQAAKTAVERVRGYILYIPYKDGGTDIWRGVDCQGWVKYCVKQAGGNADHYKGSNAMYRASPSAVFRSTLR